MSAGAAIVRRAVAADAGAIARLLEAFNREYDEPTPGIVVLTERVARLIERGEIVVFLVGDGPDGLAQMTFRTTMWADAADAYLAELYVVPGLRGQGLGRALLEAVVELAAASGATVLDLNTSEDDAAARRLYERSGFTNVDGQGSPMLYYERPIEPPD